MSSKIEIRPQDRGLINHLYLDGEQVGILTYEHVGYSEKWVLRTGKAEHVFPHAQDALRFVEKAAREKVKV